MGANLAEVQAQFLTHLAVERGLSANTISAYRTDLTQFADFLQGLGIEDVEAVTRAEIEAFLEGLATAQPDRPALKIASLQRRLASLRALFKYAVMELDLATNPAADVDGPTLPSRLPKPLSPADVTLLLDAARDADPDGIGLRDTALLELLYGTGARISEVLDLDVDDIDRDERMVRLTGKGRKQRVVPLGEYALAAVDSYTARLRPKLVAKGKGVAALFVNQRGTRLSRQSGWTILQRSAERAGLAEHVSPHTLRHSYATHLLQGGANVRVVQELLGHAAVSTTQLYTRVTLDSLREVYASSHPRAR